MGGLVFIHSVDSYQKRPLCMLAQVEQTMVRTASKPRENWTSRQSTQANCKLRLWVGVGRQNSPKSWAKPTLAIYTLPSLAGNERLATLLVWKVEMQQWYLRHQIPGWLELASGGHQWIEVVRITVTEVGTYPLTCPQVVHSLGKDMDTETNNFMVGCILYNPETGRLTNPWFILQFIHFTSKKRIHISHVLYRSEVSSHASVNFLVRTNWFVKYQNGSEI